MTSYPQYLHTVLDSTEPRRLAGFYPELLGLVYRRGCGPPTHGSPADGADWLVLLDPDGRRVLAIQEVERLEPTTWPEHDVPMQLHLDFTVPDVAALERHRDRALALGARILLDRTDEEDEPLYVFADLAGHPFCIF